MATLPSRRPSLKPLQVEMLAMPLVLRVQLQPTYQCSPPLMMLRFELRLRGKVFLIVLMLGPSVR